MRELFKVIGLLFISSVLPITIWNAVRLYLADSCDPKFGCLGVFILLTQILLFCTFLAALAVCFAYYLCLFRKAQKLAKLEKRLILIFGFLVSIFSSNALFLGQNFGIGTTIVTWVLASLAISLLIFKMGDKHGR
jgi:hypothetical protein